MFASPKVASRKIRRIAAVCIPLALATAGPVSASGVCERLGARLADLPTGFTTNASLRDFTGAVARQNIELRRARNDRRRMNCSSGSVIIIGGDDEAACAEIDDTIARMEQNLRTLKAQRRHLIGDGGEDIRRRILAAMELNGCSGAPPENREARATERQFANAAAGATEVHRNILRDLPPDSDAYPLLLDAPGTDLPLMGQDFAGSLRTICVRTCDGAFFPISSHATPADFGRDAELCRARCPGAETELYYHVLATEEADQMVSASTGRPYAELPAAFAYRARGVGAPGICGCGIPDLATDTNEQKASPAGKLTVVSPSVITIGSEKKTPPKPIEERPYDPANSKVRVVGPTFLPQEESAIDLKHPLGPRYQPLQDN
ncbi:DUF2865 domain-containing protein [Mesorhizobium plurifarium]|uniref:DUF2865 domain-containing protein n=1 Tax=Sinorhizobium arboris TaxID=76745 RepID=UPI00041A7890|nr:DUF2865 domain-containing protein [Sinorhizobium arboris]PST21823.1 DUF2865 domain-containing protein [Mesorhizobium plurifarium]